MKKPQFIVDEEGKKVGVLLSMEGYESLLDEVDDAYCNKLLDKATEVNEPSVPLEEYLKNKESLTEQKKAAKTVFDIYRVLPEDVQNEVRKLILKTETDKNSIEDLQAMSNDSFSTIWDTPENEHWDKFIRSRV